MKNKIRLCLAAVLMTVTVAQAANVTVSDSIVSLATNLTKNYAFTDPGSGQSVVVAVTMSPYSPSDPSAVFTVLDGNTHVSVDGNILQSGAGANFSASLVSASGGVTPGTVAFGITGLGIRPVQTGGNLTWTSSVTGLSVTYSNSTEIVQALDTADFSLSNATYSAQLRFPTAAYFQLSDAPAPGQSIVFNATFSAVSIDPRTNSWLTTYAGKYARIYTTDVNRTNGIAYTTWTNGTTIQSVPAYCGVQEVYSSSNFVYIRSTGLGSHIMGAWYLDTNHTKPFLTYPTNQHVLFKLPRYPSVPATNTLSGGGAVGIFVDGVAMYNNWDANIWNGTADTSSTGGTNGYWNRDAYVNEGASFDPANAHQPVSGQYHYHANPPALRYELGDHVDFNPVTKIYTESTNTPTRHSPILGWAADGYPIYGPYGYSMASNSSSGIRRMISGYVLRNGQDGTDNLNVTERSTLPLWATRFYHCTSNILAGPPVNSSYPLGRYMEDNDYLGDHGYVQGQDFDLDQYNGRWCYTPDFPGGTYAYFVAISSNGTPVYPYNIGFAYYGTPAGGSVSFIQENVATNFLGYTNLASTLNPPAVNNGTVTLAWSALEGGSYQVQGTTNFSGWTVIASGVTPNQISGGYTNVTPLADQFYRVGRTSVSNYDSAGTTYIGGGIASVSPTNASRGSSFTLTVNLNSNAGPPPSQAPVNSITIGSIAGSGNSHVSQTQATSSITIPSGATTGPQTVTIVFPGPPQNPSATQTFFLTNGFTVN